MIDRWTVAKIEAALRDIGPLTPKELALHLGLPVPALSRHLHQLAKDGVLKHHRPCRYAVKPGARATLAEIENLIRKHGRPAVIFALAEVLERPCHDATPKEIACR